MRNTLVNTIWSGADPFAGFQHRLYRSEYGGWGSSHPYLADTVTKLRPALVVEIGVWNGASVRTMAERIRDMGVDGAVLAVDTWLGSVENWVQDPGSLCFAQGRPGKQFVFMSNVVEWHLTQHVLPLPLDSLNAAGLVSHYGFTPDVIHIDGGHDYESVKADLNSWWPLMRPGGMLIGDDYYTDGNWPGVRRAFDEFFAPFGLDQLEHHSGKRRIRKPQP